MNPSVTRFPRRFRSCGFSIIELLSVIAIVAILGTMVGIGTGSNTGRQLEAAGLKAANLLEFARQNSMTRDVMSAVVLVKGQTPQIGLFELGVRRDGLAVTSADWVQVGRWEPFPSGLVVDAETLRPGGETFTPGPPQPRLKGQIVAPGDFSYAVFLPSGRLMNPAPASLRLAPGLWDSASGTGSVTRLAPDGAPANFFKLTVIGATGRVKIDRR